MKYMSNALVSENKKVNIIDFVLLMSLLWFNNGIIRIIPHFAATANLILIIIGAAFVFYKDDKFLNKLTPYGYWYGVLFLISIAFTYLAFYLTIDLEIWNILYVLIIFFVYIYFSTQSKEKQKNIVKILLIDQIIINIVSYIKILQNPMLARIYATGNSEEILSETSSTFLLSTFGHIYVSVFVVLFLLLRLRRCKTDTFEKVIYLCYILTSVILIFKASFTMAILSIIVFGICTLLASKESSAIGIIKIVVVLLAILCVLPYIINFMLKYVFSENYEVSLRLQELLDLLSRNVSSGSDASKRIYLYKKSLKSFLKYPIFGVWEINNSSLLGNHTEWIDGLARFGIIRYPLFITFFIKALRKIHSERNYPAGMFIVYAAVIMIGFVNPIMFQETYLALFIIFPLVLEERQNKVLVGE